MFSISILQNFQGYLRSVGIYTNPFNIVCASYNTLITITRTMNKTMLYCSACKQDSHFLYFHRLNCIIHASDKAERKKCILRSIELERILCALQEISYDQYYVDKIDVIEILTNFETNGTFMIDHQNIVVSIQ